MSSRTPRTAPQRKFFDQHRKAELQHLRIREPRIGHVGVNRIGAVKIRPSARAAANRFVVLIALVAEREIVHGSLRRRHDSECAIKCIDDTLRGLDIAGDHRRRISRPQHRPFRDDDLQRLEATLVHRNVVIDQGAEDIKHGRPGTRMQGH
jgi:hypothetical protein